MPEQKKIVVYVITDSLGQSAVNITRSALSKFHNLEYTLKEFTFNSEYNEIDRILNELKDEKETSLIFHTFANEKLGNYLEKEAEEVCEHCHDILTPIVTYIGEVAGIKSSKKADSSQQIQLDEQYFDRISSLEFAVAHDDGKEPKGFLEADIVILGISRTSKTPLSIYLANNNYKVANLPLMPESELPEEIWQVNPKRIIGLTNDVEFLSEIRKERMISYGLNPETIYSDRERIQEEINYALNLYNELDCKIINVANKSIEETASLIISYLNEEGLYHEISAVDFT